MILTQALRRSAHIFSLNGIENSHLEAMVLLQHVLKLSSAQLYTQPERALSQGEIRSLKGLVKRRLCHEPAAYIVGRKEFYGIDFYVDPRVLIPRPETELLVEAASEFAREHMNYISSPGRPLLVGDIGTGCGAVAISLALNLPHSKVYATDISSTALEVARLNCEYHNVTEQIVLLHGNLLEPVPESLDVIIANLPYIESSDLANLRPEIINFEPAIALDGGQGGLRHIRQFLEQAEDKVSPHGCLLFEIGKEQDKAVISMVNHYFKRTGCAFLSDLNGIKRVVKITF